MSGVVASFVVTAVKTSASGYVVFSSVRNPAGEEDEGLPPCVPT